jgi:molybdopterin/thiamine biosynthesis adenylyltransferase
MMKISFGPAPVVEHLAKLKAKYGDDWSVEMTSFLGPIIHYWARNKRGEKVLVTKSSATIPREDLALLNADRKQRGLAEIHDVGGWR